MPTVTLGIEISENGKAKLVDIADGAKKAGEQANWAQQQFEKFGETLAHGVALGAGMDIGHKLAETFIESTKAAIEFGHQIELLSVKTGIGTTALQEFDYAAKISGTTLDSIAGLVTKMDGAIEKASPGFAKLGLDVAKLSQETPEQAFRQTAEALAGVNNQIERVAIAKEVFGKAGADALPFIENMEHAARVSREMGLILSEEDVKAAADLGVAGKELEQIWDGVVRQFVAGIAAGHDFKGMVEEAAPAVKALGEAARVMGAVWEGAMAGMTLGMDKLFGAGLEKLLGKGGLMGAMQQYDFQNYNTKGSGTFPDSGGKQLFDIDSMPAPSAAAQAAYHKDIHDEKEADKEWLKSVHDSTQQLAEEMKERQKVYKQQTDEALKETERLLKEFGTGNSSVEGDNIFRKLSADIQTLGGFENLSLSQIEVFRTKVSDIGSASDTGIFSPDQWDALAESGGKVKDQLEATGQAVEVGNGLWAKNGIVAAEALEDEREHIRDVNEDLAEHIAKLEDASHTLSALASDVGQLSSLFQALGMSADSSGAKILGGIKGELQAASSFTQAMATGDVLGMVGAGLQGATALVSTVKSLVTKPEYKKVLEDVGKEWGTTITEATAKAIEATESKDHVGRSMAELLNIDKVMSDSGMDPSKFSSKIGDLMNAVKLNAVNAKEGIAELGKAFTDLKTAADGGSVSSEAAMIGMIKRARELGESIPELDAYVKGLMEDAATQLQIVLSSQAVGAGGNAQGLANNDLFNAVFTGSLSSQGLASSWAKMGPDIDAMMKSHPDTQLTGAAADAAQLAPLMKNKDGDFFKSATGFEASAKLNKDLLDSGNMSQKSLSAIETTGKTFYNQALQDAKKTMDLQGAQKAAEEAALPYLSQLQRDQAMGLKLSPDSQAMLSQAQKDGMLPALDPMTKQVLLQTQIRDGIYKIAGMSAPADGVPGAGPGGPSGGPGSSAPAFPGGIDPRTIDYRSRAIHAASGFSGTVNGWTPFVAGEAGPEHVQITPLGGGGAVGGDGTLRALEGVSRRLDILIGIARRQNTPEDMARATRAAKILS